MVITDEELAALDPKALRTIDIDEFVDLADIDPIFYDSAYYLAPDKADKPYALLARAMEESGKIGVAHFVMRSKRYLAAVRPKDGKLLLSTMVYADEIRPPEEIPGLADLDDVELSDKELEMARQLVDSLGAPVRAREVPRHLPRGRPGADRPEGLGGRDGGHPAVRRRAGQGHRSDGRPGGVGGRGQAGPRASSHRSPCRGRRGGAVRRSGPKKTTAKRAPAKKAAARKAPTKKTAAKKTAAAKKTSGASVTRIRKSA